MSTAKYPNRDALREANDIYLDAMRPFVVHYLKRVPGETVEYLIKDALKDEQADDFWEKLDEDDDIESAIDFSYFPLIIQGNWIITRNKRNYGFAQQFKNDMNVQSMLWLIRKGRNACEHRGTKDLDFEFVRINLFLIADVLGKINRPDKQHEVETIRDKLDDTAERLAEAEERLRAAESESSDYKASLLKVEERLEAAESEKNKYEEDNATLSNQVDEKERRLKKLSGQLKRAKTERDNSKKNLAGTKKRLDKSEAAKADYKGHLDTKSKELKNTKADWKSSEERLAARSNELAAAQAENKDIRTQLTTMPDLFTTATLEKPEIQSIFPAFDTDSRVRILDRRGTDKRHYLLNLLEQKQSTLIYVQSEEKVNQLLARVLPEEAGVIEKFYETMPEEEKKEILEKLENGELTAVVSNATFSALTSSHPFEHFVFCHLVPSLDVFCERCQPAFTSARNVYLHLIYESKQNIERYPKDETIRELYRELQKLAEANDDFINHENVYNALNMKKLEIETGLVILEELQYLERKKMGIKLLQSSGKQLEESTTYCRGEKLRVEAENSPSFQYEHSVEQIWEEIEKKVDIGNERILHENNISTELEEITVESLTESVEGISETTATEMTEKDRNDIAVQVVELRINAAGLKPLAWKRIREKLGLKYNQFHKDIRHSAGYRKAVIDRIKSLKSQEGGWEYSGKLDNLTGIDDISEDELK